MEADPLVSVALPVFNGASTLSMAIRSIQRQSHVNWELLILDDGSVDQSLAVAENFRDPRIKIMGDGQRKGVSVRLNQAISLAQGKYIARMDVDDISFPDRLARQVSLMEAHPEVDLTGCAMLVFKADGDIVGRYPVFTEHEDICRRPWKGFYFPHPSWLGKKRWFEKFRYTPSVFRAQDQHLLFRSYATSRFRGLDEVLIGYREEPRSLKKMALQRLSFSNALGSTALANGDYFLAARLILLQILKGGGDFLNIALGAGSMRNPLETPGAHLREKWFEIFHDLQE